MKYKIYTDREFERLLKKNGYTIERYNGSHTIWVKPGHNSIAVPKSVNPMVIRRLIKENNLEE